MPKESRGHEKKIEDAWSQEVPKFKKGDMKHRLAEMTSFSVNYPSYRETYIKECFPLLKRALKEQEITVEQDALKGSLTVTTTANTWDPYAILLARDVIKLISRNVPLEEALRIFDDNITSELIIIKNFCRDQEVFVKRRDRLFGKDNKSKAAVEKLTGCSLFIQGGSVSIIGPHKGVMKAIRFVKGCMSNKEHPYFSINALYMQNTLAENAELKDSDWSKLIPNYKPKNTKKKKKVVIKPKSGNPLPPAPLESKLDQRMEGGEYFVSNKLKKPQLSKEERRQKSNKIQAEKRAAQYIAPEEPVHKRRKVETEPEVDIGKLKKKVKKQKKALGKKLNM